MVRKIYSLIATTSLIVSCNTFALSQGLSKDKDGLLCTSTLCAMNSSGGLYGGITGYYVRPSESGIGLVTDSWQYADASGNVRSLSKPFDPDHEWEGSYKVGYDFPGTANNLEVSYFHLNNDTHAINNTSDSPVSFGSVFFPNVLIPLAPGTPFVSDAHLRYKLDQVDLIVGRKYSDMSGSFWIRPSLGLRYARVEHNLTFVAPGSVFSKFDGVGPLMGIDGNYALGRGFGLVGHFDYSPIIGQVNSNSQLTFGTTFSFVSPKRDRIVNSVTGRLGIDYGYLFTNNATATIEVGYQVSDYVDALDVIRGDIAPAQKIVGIETTSFGFRGPYINLTVHA